MIRAGERQLEDGRWIVGVDIEGCTLQQIERSANALRKASGQAFRDGEFLYTFFDAATEYKVVAKVIANAEPDL